MLSRSAHSAVPARRTLRRLAPEIPAFALYGETAAAGGELLHVEGIQARSRRYRWQIDAHLHHGLYQVVWLRKGPVQVSLDALREDCTGPVAIIIPPGSVHAFQFAADSEGEVLTLSARSFIEGETPEVGDSLRALFSVPRILHLDPDALETCRLEGLLDQLVAEFQAPDTVGAPVTPWLARAVVWRLARIGARGTGADDPGARRHHALFTRFVLLVEAHYTEHWPVSRYARHLGVSPDRLNRLVRTQTGAGALNLVHERLVREACRRLIYVAVSISRIAFELGFDDPAYFCRFFKRGTGSSPREFRTLQRALRCPPG